MDNVVLVSNLHQCYTILLQNIQESDITALESFCSITVNVLDKFTTYFYFILLNLFVSTFYPIVLIRQCNSLSNKVSQLIYFSSLTTRSSIPKASAVSQKHTRSSCEVRHE